MLSIFLSNCLLHLLYPVLQTQSSTKKTLRWTMSIGFGDQSGSRIFCQVLKNIMESVRKNNQLNNIYLVILGSG